MGACGNTTPRSTPRCRTAEHPTRIAPRGWPVQRIRKARGGRARAEDERSRLRPKCERRARAAPATAPPAPEATRRSVTRPPTPIRSSTRNARSRAWGNTDAAQRATTAAPARRELRSRSHRIPPSAPPMHTRRAARGAAPSTPRTPFRHGSGTSWPALYRDNFAMSATVAALCPGIDAA
jgi:hypothetical protein